MKRMNIIFAGAILFAAAALAAGPAAAQTCVEPPEGLVSWWPGDGDAADVASGLDGTPANGAGFMPGLVGFAFRLDGVGGGQDDRVDLPADALNGLADFTIEMWMNSTDGNEGAILSAANGAAGGDNELLLFQAKAPTDVSLYVKQTSSGRLPLVLNDGAWHHVAIVREGGTGHLYVDGMLTDSLAYPVGPMDVGPGGLMLGQEQDCLGGCFSPAQAFDGLVDELAVYSRALSTDELLAVFDAGADGKCKPAPGLAVDDLMLRIEDLEADVDALTQQVLDLEERMDGHSHEASSGPGAWPHFRLHKWKERFRNW